MNNRFYQSPLSTRYASKEMSALFSSHFKIKTWRKLWVALAEAQQQLGLSISNEQIEELRKQIDSIDFEVAAEYEKKLQHDVMAHIHAYADQCPKARSIIHLGATSCFVTDNADLIQMREGLALLIDKLTSAIKQFSAFAMKYAHLPCLGFTHFQPAQLTTVGKRCCLWIQDLLLDLKQLKFCADNLYFLGMKGATGTQASLLHLFQNDQEKVKALDQMLTEKMGFKKLLTIAGQTYTRKQDTLVLSALCGVAASSHKFATDLRLLAHLKEIEEPFLAEQVGSSAMPYKRNPILSERLCGISRYLISLLENPFYTAATQWLERSLDDSANRRICIPEAFLACDAILELLLILSRGLQVNETVISAHIAKELPFMATEKILMTSVKKGGDRQSLHEKLRQYSLEIAEQLKTGLEENDLMKRIAEDPDFRLTKEEIEQLTDIKDFLGRAPEQVQEFLKNEL